MEKYVKSCSKLVVAQCSGWDGRRIKFLGMKPQKWSFQLCSTCCLKTKNIKNNYFVQMSCKTAQDKWHQTASSGLVKLLSISSWYMTWCLVSLKGGELNA